MPKFIGQDDSRIPTFCPCGREVVKVTWSQVQYLLQHGLTPSDFGKVLDTSDKWSKGSLAKRWYRWYVYTAAIRPEIVLTKALEKKVWS